MKKVLITGANSYIGESVKAYLLREENRYLVDIVDTVGWEPTVDYLSGYDVIFNVAGIAHIKETDDNRHLYYDINRDLAVKIAEVAKLAGVHHYILLSSMSVYGLDTGYICKSSTPHPTTAYGDSKLQADEIIKKIEDESFIFACLRPPMVYGKGCKGNYQSLRKFAIKSIVFPNFYNQRSMIYIGNLCEFIKNCIDNEYRGVFFPQNATYTNTSEMVKLIALSHGKKIIMTKAFNWIIKMAPMKVVRKVFGSLTYEPVDLVDKYGFVESIRLTEGD